MTDFIYKVTTRQQWTEATNADFFSGAAIDVTDGYIHFSTAAQLVETVRRHFHGQTDLVIVCVDATQLGDKLRWELSRGGDLFPHLYEPLPISAAVEVIALPQGENGLHIFPPGPWERS